VELKNKMKTTKKTQYALRAMLFIAKRKETICSLRLISEEENISPAYLEKIFSLLERKQLVASKRGATGGYILSRLPNKITLKDIFDAVEEQISIVECLNRSCPRDNICSVSSTWREINKKIEKALSSIKLSDLLN
jgi:Rrf2 family protein